MVTKLSNQKRQKLLHSVSKFPLAGDLQQVISSIQLRGCLLLLCVLLQVLPLLRVKAEDRVDYKFENYQEEHGRIGIRTHGLFFATDLTSRVALRGNVLYDSISGATPTGAPPAPGSDQGRMVQIDDARKAGYLESTFKFDRHQFTPQFAYSTESDYESIGISGNYALELNQKNTTLNLGASHNFDRVIATPNTWIRETQDKDATQVLVGINQLLGPKTVLTGNLMFGYDQGYLADPYKGAAFEDFPYFPPFPYTLFPEKRPGHRSRQVASLSILQRLEKWDASVEGSYRFHHDDWGVNAHTFSVEWNQKIGSRVIFTPLLRYHHQSAADFYGVMFPGDPSLSDEGVPANYSADYRLSNLHTFTYGAQVSFILKDQLFLDLGYKRYVMRGLDRVTPDSAYPKSNIFTVGLRLWF
jgi:hypothetical protein